jgi:hypothetical protein
LGQWKAVEAFLVDGHAERYLGASVLFIEDGRDPVLTLKEQATGRIRERIHLKEYNSEEALRELMETKLGFQKRTQKEYERYKQRQRKLQADWDVENERRTLEEGLKMKRKKDEIAARVLKMMEENLKKQAHLADQEIKV